jgi:glycosyltransferase involved in cell wall biosynthesis
MKNRPLRVLAVIPGSAQGEGMIFARRQIGHLAQLGVETRVFFLESRTNPLAIFGLARKFRRECRQFLPDVVHAHYGTITALFAVVFSRCPVVVSFRGSDLNPSSEFSAPRATLSRWMSQLAALGAREIICVSEGLRNRLWWRRGRVHVIRSGVDVHEFYPRPRDEVRSELGWSPNDCVILFNHGPARSPNKRKALVDAAMEIVKQQKPEARLFVLDGQVPGRSVPQYINASDVVVMASRFEGSPNIVKEALACNTPVCSVAVGDVPELLAGVENCRIVEPTPESMAEGLLDLIRFPVRSNGSKYIDRFAADEQARRILAVLHSAAGWSSRRSAMNN